MHKLTFFTALITMILMETGCNKSSSNYDATGTFEARDIIVSAEANGKIIFFDAREGDVIKQGQKVVNIDTVPLFLQKEQIESTIDALKLKQNSPDPQISVLLQQQAVAESQVNSLQDQLKILNVEQNRIAALYKGQAATAQQMDDINGKVEMMQSQINTAKKQRDLTTVQIKSTKAQITIQNRSILSEQGPIEKKTALILDQIKRTTVLSPINGTMLIKYAEAGEFVTVGKPIFKIADLSEMTLKAYFTGDQLSLIQIGQAVDVYVDHAGGNSKSYNGKITTIAQNAEFTPKTIQTKEERTNLVYAVKIAVKNDGMIKIGMSGEVVLKSPVERQ